MNIMAEEAGEERKREQWSQSIHNYTNHVSQSQTVYLFVVTGHMELGF